MFHRMNGKLTDCTADQLNDEWMSKWMNKMLIYQETKQQQQRQKLPYLQNEVIALTEH